MVYEQVMQVATVKWKCSEPQNEVQTEQWSTKEYWQQQPTGRVFELERWGAEAHQAADNSNSTSTI